MRGVLIWLTIVAAAFFIYTTAKADSVAADMSISTSSQPSYGLGLEHDWDWTYIGLSNSFTADYLSSSTSLAYGLRLFGSVSLGVFSGYITNNGGLRGEGGLELGFEVPLNNTFFIDENNRIYREAADPNTELSLSVGLGLRL